MEATRITSEGQVLIPKAIRDALGIQPGTLLNAEAKDGAVVLRPVAKERRLREIRAWVRRGVDGLVWGWGIGGWG